MGESLVYHLIGEPLLFHRYWKAALFRGATLGQPKWGVQSVSDSHWNQARPRPIDQMVDQSTEEAIGQ
jgi:hypothetical protein